jgi:hypothetical protein
MIQRAGEGRQRSGAFVKAIFGMAANLRGERGHIVARAILDEKGHAAMQPYGPGSGALVSIFFPSHTTSPVVAS